VESSSVSNTTPTAEAYVSDHGRVRVPREKAGFDKIQPPTGITIRAGGHRNRSAFSASKIDHIRTIFGRHAGVRSKKQISACPVDVLYSQKVEQIWILLVQKHATSLLAQILRISFLLIHFSKPDNIAAFYAIIDSENYGYFHSSDRTVARC